MICNESSRFDLVRKLRKLATFSIRFLHATADFWLYLIAQLLYQDIKTIAFFNNSMASDFLAVSESCAISSSLTTLYAVTSACVMTVSVNGVVDDQLDQAVASSKRRVCESR